MPSFNLTDRQQQANALLGSTALHTMLYGGSRSGKTLLIIRAIVTRALAHKSRHAVLRYRFNHLKGSVLYDTLPKVMELCFPGVADHCHLDKSDWFYTLPNQSEIWFGGLDEKERTEKILGAEYSSIFLNECSQIPWASRNMAMTRLAQQTPLRLRAYYDCVSGDTVLDGHTKTIAELAELGEPITVLTTHGWRRASAPWCNGHGDLFLVTTNTGRSIKVTKSHRFWTPGGWKRLDRITIGQRLLCIDEARFPRDDQGVRVQRKKAEGSQGSYYRYPRRCDGQPLRGEDCDLSGPASASDVAGHIQSPFRHVLSGSRKDRFGTRVVQHSRHSQARHALLSQAFGFWPSHMESCGGPLVFGSSRQRHLLPRIFLLGALDRLVAELSGPLGRLSAWTTSYLQAVYDRAAIYRQWLHYSLRKSKSHDQTFRSSKALKTDLLSCDTPRIDNGEYEIVVGIEKSTAVAYYTVEVPQVRHYSAHGFVSHNCNPPSENHWTKRVFIDKIDPDTRQALKDPQNYTAMVMNPRDNEKNLPKEYLKELEDLPERMRRRFLLGQFGSAVSNALWTLEGLDSGRVLDGVVPDLQRVVIGVDPSGCAGPEDTRSDEVGIVVAALGVDGRAYVLEDLSGRFGPHQWGQIVASAFDRHQADCVVGETNYGGAMVQEVIKVARPMTPFKAVTASRGKVVRAEPVAALYGTPEKVGKVSHVGIFARLEDQLCGFTTAGYAGDRSPDRADALVWALTELFPALAKPARKKLDLPPVNMNAPLESGLGWLR